MKSFKEYAQRWRELTAQVEPHLSKSEITRILVDTLKDPFFDTLVSSGAYEFTELVVIGDQIEKVLKDDKIRSNVRASNAPKKFSRNF